MAPCDYKTYPADWKEIRARIRRRARNRCEKCGVKNGAKGFRFYKGFFMEINSHVNFLDPVTGRARHYQPGDIFRDPAYTEFQEFKVIKIVCTVAHLNQNKKDNGDENLKYLCQKDHLDHDRKENLQKRSQNNGQNHPGKSR